MAPSMTLPPREDVSDSRFFRMLDSGKSNYIERPQQNWSNLKLIRTVGNGAFGVVYEAKLSGSHNSVALKKVPQDKRFKNRELDILKFLSNEPHENIVSLLGNFSAVEGNNEILNLVLEFIPETLGSQMKHFEKSHYSTIPMSLLKIYIADAFKALSHLQKFNICHRDIKPQNLLVDPTKPVLKLADFGSAKVLNAAEPNISYICSRFYRAPELILGATQYSTAVDVWGLGCVIGECLIGTPVFPGSNQVEVLIEMIKLIGPPTQQDFNSMKVAHQQLRLPALAGTSLSTLMFTRVEKLTESDRHLKLQAVDLLEKVLCFNPESRLTAAKALSHPFLI